MAYAAFPFNGNDSNVNFFSYWLLFIGCWLLSPFATTFLRSGQAENFVRPENKFLVPCAQNPSFLLTMQRYEIFKGLANKIPKNHTFWSLIFALILQEIKMRRNEGQKRHSNTQFWTFGRGRLDVKAFSKIKRRK